MTISDLSAAATPGTWYPRTYRGRQNKVYGAVDTDTLLGIAESTDASDTQFITALVNAYRSGHLVVNEWRPIAEAPKDGTWIRAFFPDWVKNDETVGNPAPGQIETYWLGSQEDGIWLTPGRTSTVKRVPTHFMPLPAAPKGTNDD